MLYTSLIKSNEPKPSAAEALATPMQISEERKIDLSKTKQSPENKTEDDAIISK